MGNSKRDKGAISWAEAIQKAIGVRGNPPVGEGWLTAKEFAKKHKLGLRRATGILIAGVKKGVIERHDGSKENPSGKLVTGTWYRPASR